MEINKFYGQLPTPITEIQVDCKEMMFYQYLPIKLVEDPQRKIALENRLEIFRPLIEKCCIDFIDKFGLSEYWDNNIYLTAKHLFQLKDTSFNRLGYHSDGFLTDDINYIWSNNHPTIFNQGKFNLTLDDKISMMEMEEQAKVENEMYFPNNTILRLDQYNIHRVMPIQYDCMRTFIKVSFSKDKYDLEGNAHNHLLDYNWEMKKRKIERNIPQSKL